MMSALPLRGPPSESGQHAPICSVNPVDRAIIGPAAVIVPAVSVASPTATPQIAGHQLSRSCADPAPGQAACMAVRNTPVTAAGQAVHQDVTANVSPAGYGPAALHSAYKLPDEGGAGQTVAIVDAYDNPNAEADLAVYRTQYGLSDCTTANGCFRKVGNFGSGVLPAVDAGWAQEISLDLDVVSATCPGCKILLVEANDASFINLGIAVDVAVLNGATVVSNSYGGQSSIFDFAYDLFFYNHPGVPVTASSATAALGCSILLPHRFLPLSAERHWLARITAAGGRRRPGPERGRGVPPSTSSRPGSRTPPVAGAPSRTSPPWQIPKPGSRSMTACRTRAPAGGRFSAAPVSRRR